MTDQMSRTFLVNIIFITNLTFLFKQAIYIQSTGLGGGMVWALDLDDFSGNFCGEGPWPLMKNVKKYILESKSIFSDFCLIT